MWNIACKEVKPCTAKISITCDCRRRKQEGKCGASSSNPWPVPRRLPCDDECARLKRNAALAEALRISPEHGDSHIPYSDTTLDLYKETPSWAVMQDREFRAFAADETKKVHRFKPMAANQRAFLHSLAADYGLDSESQDSPPHRSVVLYKTPRFVSAPLKSLSQALSLRASQAAEASRAAAAAAVELLGEPFNAFVLASPKFGLTVEDVEEGLKNDFALQPTVAFVVAFLPSDEVVIRGASRSFAHAVSATALENILKSMKPAISKTVTSQELAQSVALCHADASMGITRRERGANSSAGGWNTVVSRSMQKAAAGGGPSSLVREVQEEEPKPGRVTLGLKKKKKTPEPEPEPVDDWLEAAEKLED